MSINEKTTLKIKQPIAWTIADLNSEEHRNKFSITDGHISVLNKLENDKLSHNNLTSVDKLLQTFSPQLTRDHIGGEDFSTALETKVKQDIYTSFHYMVLGGRGGQHFHYHPPGSAELPESSLRVVILNPLYNKAENQGGITFEWFDVEDVKLITPENSNKNKPSTRYIEGNPVSPRYKVHFPPGHIGVVAFGRGVHRFLGHALAVSLHFMDVAHGGGGGSFEGNTAAWLEKDGDVHVPQEEKIIELHQNTTNRNNNIKNASLRSIFAHQGRVSRKYIEEVLRRPTEERRQEPLDRVTLNNLITDLGL